MKIENSTRAFFSYFICLIMYLAVIGINEMLLTFYFNNNNVSYNEFDQIKYYNLLGYVFAALYLLLFSKYLHIRVNIMLFLVLYILSLISICASNIDFQTNFFYFSMYSASYSVLGSIIFIYLFCADKIKTQSAFICLGLAPPIAHFIHIIFSNITAESYIKIKENFYGLLAIVNISFIIIMSVITFSTSIFKSNIAVDNNNFASVVKNSQLEIVCGFSLFYILSLFSIIISKYNIEPFVGDNIFRYIILLIGCFILGLIGTYIRYRYIRKYNIHIDNIISIALLLILIPAIYFFANDNIINFFEILILTLFFLKIIIGNIKVMISKFETKNLIDAIHLYLLASTVGYFGGYITNNAALHSLGENQFLILVCFVLFSLLTYYIYFFRKYRLWQWKNST